LLLIYSPGSFHSRYPKKGRASLSFPHKNRHGRSSSPLKLSLKNALRQEQTTKHVSSPQWWFRSQLSLEPSWKENSDPCLRENVKYIWLTSTETRGIVERVLGLWNVHHADALMIGLEPSLFVGGDMVPSTLSPSRDEACALPQPLTRMCLYRSWSVVISGTRNMSVLTLSASLREKLLSQ